MRKKRRISGIVLVIVALLIMQLPVSEADAATSASDFKITGTTLNKYQGTEKSVSVPATVERIAKSAFENNETIESLSFSNGVTEIGPYAFWGCTNLQRVYLNQGLKEIPDFSFTNCKGLLEMNVPKSVTSIGIQAFADCVNLRDITIPPEVTFIHESAFDGCVKLVIHSEEGSYASKYAKMFYERQKEMPEYEDVENYEPETNLPDTEPEQVTDTEPETVTDGKGTLGSTSVVGNQAVVFIDNTSLHVYEGDYTYNEPQTPTIEDDGIINESGIPKYCIVDGLVVADQAYYKNANIVSAQLPAGIREIGEFAYARSSIKEIQLPGTVEVIGYGAFYHCDQLENIQLPVSVKKIEPKAFAYTKWLQDFYQTGKDDFLINADVLVAYKGDEAAVSVPDGVRLIAAEAFAGHNEISSLYLPNSVQIIGEAAFENCAQLTTVLLNDLLIEIDDRAFAGCGLTGIKLPSSLEMLGIGAFDKDVLISYAGETPKTSYEHSAQRLSNMDYRNLDEEEPVDTKVTVEGINGAAQLEGADRAYTLQVTVQKQMPEVTTAFYRNLHKEVPEDAVIYQMLFTDSSKIPITKLGKRKLKAVFEVPEELKNQNVNGVLLDRNGQPETIEVKKSTLNGNGALSISLNKVGTVVLYGGGAQSNEFVEYSAQFTSMSSQTERNADITPLMYAKWAFGGFVLVLGLFLALTKVK